MSEVGERRKRLLMEGGKRAWLRLSGLSRGARRWAFRALPRIVLLLSLLWVFLLAVPELEIRFQDRTWNRDTRFVTISGLVQEPDPQAKDLRSFRSTPGAMVFVSGTRMPSDADGKFTVQCRVQKGGELPVVGKLGKKLGVSWIRQEEGTRLYVCRVTLR